MSVLPSQCKYALGLEKESVNKMHLVLVSTWKFSSMLYSKQNKCYIPYSEVMFSHFIIQLQNNGYEISVKKYTTFFSFIRIIK